MCNDALDFQVGQATNTIIIDGAREYPAFDVCADRVWCVTVYISPDADPKDLPPVMRRYRGCTFKIDNWWFTKKGAMQARDSWRRDWTKYGIKLFCGSTVVKRREDAASCNNLYLLKSAKSC